MCPAQARLVELLDGRLSGEPGATVRAHVDACATCSALVVDLTSHLGDTARASGAQPGDPAWSPPRRIDEYELLALIGRGSAGQVWRANDLYLDREVAIKFLSRPSHEGALHRFRLEGRALARLTHPSVVTVHRVGEVDGRPYLVSELVRGETLAQLAKPVTWQEAARIGESLARGLAAAHRAGVLHRDIKPANVVLAEGGGVKLLDFGLAKLHDAAPDPTPAGTTDVGRDLGAGAAVTTSGLLVGTPLYMAPEAWNGLPATVGMDLYSLGAVLYELAAGHAPHTGPGLETLRQQILGAPIAPLPATIDERFARVVERCLAREPSARWRSADELADALADLPDAAAPVVPVRSSRWGLLLAGLGAASIGGFALLALRGSDREPRALDVNEAGDGLASALATGDFDDDGRADLAVGVPGEDGGRGAVDLFRGTLTGLVPWRRLAGEAAGARFGGSLAVADFDGDGVDDLAVGAPGGGFVQLLAGRAGDAPAALPGRARLSGSAGFARALAVGDLDHDGRRDDLVVAADAAQWFAGGAGGLGDGQVLPISAHALAVGDVDGDGDDDLVTGGRGAVQFFRQERGGLGSPVPIEVTSLRLAGEDEADELGDALAVGDLDGDGRAEVAIGAPGGRLGGRVYLFRGRADGLPAPWRRVIQRLDEPGDRFGSRLLVLPAADGHPALLAVGAPGERPNGDSEPRAGQVYLISYGNEQEAWSRLLGAWLAQAGDGDAFSAELASGDVDGDASLDVLVGAPGFAASDAPGAGAAFRFERQGQGFAARQVLHQALGPVRSPRPGSTDPQ